MPIEVRRSESRIYFLSHDGETYRLPTPDRLRALAHASTKKTIDKLFRHFETVELDYEVVDSSDGENQMLAVIAHADGKTLRLLQMEERPYS